MFHTLEVCRLALRHGVLRLVDSNSGNNSSNHHHHYHSSSSNNHSSSSSSSSEANGFLKPILDELRGSHGCRLRNAEANTGCKKFAFNSVQVQALPKALRPPTHAASGGVLS